MLRPGVATAGMSPCTGSPIPFPRVSGDRARIFPRGATLTKLLWNSVPSKARIPQPRARRLARPSFSPIMYRMGDYGAHDLAALLTDTRTLTRHDHTMRRAIANNDYYAVAPTQVLPSATWHSLALWQRTTVTALGVGRSMRTGVLVGRSAARVLGIPVVALTPEDPEVVLPSGGTPSTSGRMPGVRYRKAAYAEDEVRQLHGVRVTSPIRTVIDIARYHGFVEGLIALDWLLAKRFCTKEAVKRHLIGMGRVVGKKTVLRVIEHASPSSESPLESWFRAELIQRGVRGWVFQARVGRFRADFLFDDHVILEIDGRSKYADAPREILMRERDRERELMNQGYVIRRVYFEDLLHDMDGVMEMIAQARENGSPGFRLRTHG